MPTLTISGVPHVYELTAPTSKPEVLVFVHGWMLSRNYWQPLIEQLSQEYQCLSYDLRGFGQSQPQDAVPTFSESDSGNVAVATQTAIAQYSLLSYARDLGMLLRALQISKAWLIGHSLGGYVALWAADQMPEQIQGVICLNSGGGIYLKEAFERFRSAGQQMVKLRPKWLPQIPCLDLVFTRANVASTIARSWGRQRVVDFVSANPEAAIGTLLDSTTEAEVHRLPQVVARLSQPLHFIAGAKDTVMEPKYVRHLASFHPLFGDCADNVLEIPDCGHLSMLEKTDVVESRIREILRSH
ncbi:alpha/beta fold hydrolase [Leptolyngbya sp. NIES-2104]|uniref:alpha/beta fold hydrolase n=1 Tax=Leptolyngbya sp. NIES-2104 TaxID=1552121 RepID=UPI0006EC861B|nr:alpha/beta hydrolase [Leptolyngbya sp. NIES-2104]GAP94387.1 possible alpha/beta hydrolase superfamily [Leptolyngbya sp. NIES-2104]